VTGLSQWRVETDDGYQIAIVLVGVEYDKEI
jgi:hypothetical protein